MRLIPASYNLCLRCHYGVRKPYRYHKACQQAEEDERRDRILALPETEVTDEDVRRFFTPDPTPFDLQRKEKR